MHALSFKAGAPLPDALAAAAPPLPLLSEGVIESWSAAGTVQRGHQDGFDYAQAGAYLFASLRLKDEGDLADLSARAYQRLLAFLAARGRTHLLRVWNFFPHINEGAGDAERYRRFVLGRHGALAHQDDYERRLCAATVIGTAGEELVIQVLAGEEAGVAVENPRQVSAYRYPREYGPRSPSFARATRCGDLLLVSGTASIVGHATRHPGDPAAQMVEILENLRSLLAEAGGAWTPAALRLYVRRAADASQAAVLQAWAPACPVSVWLGDICRSDLDVEVEGVFTAG